MHCSPRRSMCMRIMLAGLMLAGCADPGKENPVNAQRLMLNEGYSLLYSDAEKLDLAELILYVKAESQAFEEIVHAVSDAGERVEHDLEQIAKDYPGVRIDLDPLPEMEKRKRKAIGEDRAREFAPLVGRGGREYERTVLISFSNAFNHERHLCKVMAEEEPDANLKKFLIETGRHYDELYERSMALLEKEYFKPEAAS
ncbi:MAG: hypothetical protein ACT4QA_05135 [Panacagrimonas sp.]